MAEAALESGAEEKAGEDIVGILFRNFHRVHRYMPKCRIGNRIRDGNAVVAAVEPIPRCGFVHLQISILVKARCATKGGEVCRRHDLKPMRLLDLGETVHQLKPPS